MQFHATDKVWNFNNGSVLEFGYCEKENDVYNYQCFHPDTEILTEDGWRVWQKCLSVRWLQRWTRLPEKWNTAAVKTWQVRF